MIPRTGISIPQQRGASLCGLASATIPLKSWLRPWNGEIETEVISMCDCAERLAKVEAENEELKARQDALKGRQDALEAENEALRGELDAKDERLAELKAENEALREELDAKDDRIETLEDDVADLTDAVEDLEEQLAEVEKRSKINESRVDAAVDKTDEKIAEIQMTLMRRGVRLREATVDEIDLPVDHDQLKHAVEGGQEVVYLPEAMTETTGPSELEGENLLPIQQLARMNDGRLASTTETRGQYIGVKIWQQRIKHGAGDGSIWSRGADGLEWLDASDARQYIRYNLEREDEDLSKNYAKKLAGRALEFIQEFANNRCYVKKRQHTKDGLTYQERRLHLPGDAHIPGEDDELPSARPGTNDVPGHG